MRVLIVGDTHDFADAAIYLASVRDLHIGSAKTTVKVEQLLDNNELAVVIVQFRQGDSWDPIRVLAGMGTRIIVITQDATISNRDSAFEAGASEVLFLPVDPLRLEAATLSLLGRVPRRDARCPTSLPAIVNLPGGSSIAARVSNLSRGGLEALTREMLPLGTVIHVLFQEGPDLPRLFAYVVGRSDGPDGTMFVHARFVGLLREEEARLIDYLRSVSPEAAMSPVLNALATLDGPTVLSALHSEVAGIRVPPLTELEVKGLSSPEGSVHDIALARVRVLMLATLQNQKRPGFQLPPPTVLDAWRSDLDDAVRALARRLHNADEDEETLQPLLDLQSRVKLAQDQLSQIVSETGLTAEGT